ncbi:nicotinate (nicotinamide) nucleotide adenylyltransferase [Rhodoferax sp.]|uniref:nicotinate (nicotinamide) nucleotide adenylyltransferase n=1 Tax=Rhodoferax sp. TaxID=50421 RepID=UPI0025D76C25|nr:nicotinate (nicotinamide) nucleotide adenylyltransferase [Rhodoferax sp.]MCM2296549.1 nicotinate (nicotinamide) nucleotide adenylyltransferase [Rhodoferax sp.]
MPQARRIGVFGGAFDPPHLAHRALLETALNELKLDVLHVVPTGDAWHKPRQLTSAVHRLAMVQLAFGDVAKICIDRREIDRVGPSYTIDTLRQMAAEEPGAELFLLMGADQAAALTSWHEWQAIVQLAIISVATRAHSSNTNDSFEAERLFPERFLHLGLPALHVSATQIRSNIANGQPVQTLVSEPVARYIADHHLYQSH